MRKLVLGSWQLRSVKRSGNNGAQVRCRTGDSNDLVEALLGGKNNKISCLPCYTLVHNGRGSTLCVKLGRRVIGSTFSPTYASRRAGLPVVTDQVERPYWQGQHLMPHPGMKYSTYILRNGVDQVTTESGSILVNETLENQLVLAKMPRLLLLALVVGHGTVAAHEDNLVVRTVRLNETFTLQLALFLFPLTDEHADFFFESLKQVLRAARFLELRPQFRRDLRRHSFLSTRRRLCCCSSLLALLCLSTVFSIPQRGQEVRYFLHGVRGSGLPITGQWWLRVGIIQ